MGGQSSLLVETNVHIEAPNEPQKRFLDGLMAALRCSGLVTLDYRFSRMHQRLDGVLEVKRLQQAGDLAAQAVPRFYPSLFTGRYGELIHYLMEEARFFRLREWVYGGQVYWADFTDSVAQAQAQLDERESSERELLQRLAVSFLAAPTRDYL